MVDNTYNPLSDSSIEPDPNQSASAATEEDVGSEIANQLTGQSYSDDAGDSNSDDGE